MPNRVYKIAGLARQVYILSWKNVLLARRNYVGTALEVLSPFIFIAFMVIIRYFIERFKYDDEFIPSMAQTSDILSLFNQTGSRDLVLYYPNNDLIKTLVENAVVFIRSSNPRFNPTGNFFWILFLCIKVRLKIALKRAFTSFLIFIFYIKINFLHVP
jgi:hypothetical protein